MPLHGFALFGAVVVPLVLGETGQLGGELGHRLGHLAPLLVSLTAGGMGNNWRRAELERVGFEPCATLRAASPLRAIEAWEEAELIEASAIRQHSRSL